VPRRHVLSPLLHEDVIMGLDASAYDDVRGLRWPGGFLIGSRPQVASDLMGVYEGYAIVVSTTAFAVCDDSGGCAFVVSMSIYLSAGRSLNQTNFDDAAEFRSDGSPALVIDLTLCERFIDLYAIVALLTITHAAVNSGRPVHFVMGKYQNPVQYLARMHFFHHLPGEGVEFLEDGPPRVRERERPLLELRRLDFLEGHVSIERMVDFVWDEVPIRLRESFADALSEVASNVVDHAEARDAFVLGQRYNTDYGPRRAPRIHLVVGDNGMGIRESFARSDQYSGWRFRSHSDAVALALEPDVTSKPGIHSGIGLPTVRDHAIATRGLLQIRTGDTTYRETRSGASTWPGPRFSGTIVSVELCKA
jgi:hypothetical protein